MGGWEKSIEAKAVVDDAVDGSRNEIYELSILVAVTAFEVVDLARMTQVSSFGSC